jgi:CubicO group peptidase (beta-lactamase class C family)
MSRLMAWQWLRRNALGRSGDPAEERHVARAYEGRHQRAGYHAEERAENRVFLGDHSGWGIMMLVPAADGSTGIPGGYGWEGGSGTTWRTDTASGLTGILLTQRMVTSPEPTELVTDFWAAAYAAIDG